MHDARGEDAELRAEVQSLLGEEQSERTPLETAYFASKFAAGAADLFDETENDLLSSSVGCRNARARETLSLMPDGGTPHVEHPTIDGG